MIRARSIIRKFKRGKETITALKGIDLDINPGEFVILLGPSGAGKTTLLNIIGGMDRPDQGSLEIDGKSILDADMTRYRRNNIGFIFSEFHLIPTLSAYENVLLPQLWSRKRDKTYARKLMSYVELDHRLKHFPKELSGGEMQRVAIARSLTNHPKIVLADEPTANLDTRTRDLIIRLFARLTREQEISVLLATHDTSIARSGDRTIGLSEGRIIGY